MVAGDEHHLGVRAERPADRREHGTRGGERLAQRPVAQLEGVAEQDEPAGAVEAREQRFARGRAAQDVDAVARAEVQVGDDEGPHGPRQATVSAVPAALEDILVADFSRVLAGPLCTMTLGDLGADVVKVERPDGGDDTREWGPPWHDEGATYYLGLNRNKRSVTLDLKDPADLALARRLATRADVVVESFRPGTIDRLGLGYDAIAADNRGVVYCSISAFGTGERAAALPGYDLLLQAMSGLMSVTGESDGRPLKVGAALIDMICGLYAANAVLAALHARPTTGAGQRVHISLMDSALSALLNQGSAFLNAGVVPGRLGNRHPSITPYETFRAADGDFAVACGNDTLFRRLCGAIERPDLPDDERFATNAVRLENRDELVSGRVDWTLIGVGFVVSFVVAIVVIRWFVGLISKRGFAPFAWYRIVAGSAALVWLLTR